MTTTRLLALVLLVLALSACSPNTPLPFRGGDGGEVNTPPVTPTPTPTVTSTPDWPAITATAHAMTIEELEAQAAALEAQRALEAIRSQQTQVAAAQTQQSIQSTQAANATATTLAIHIINANIAGTQAASTSTAQVQQAHEAFAGTATQSAFHAQSTLEAASNAALATAQAARAQNAQAAADRVVMTNTFIAWLQALAPILAALLIILVIFLIAWIWYRINKTRLIQPNAQGAYPMIYDNGRLLNGSRAFSPVVDPDRPALPADENIQAQIALAETRNGAVRAVSASASPDQALRRLGQSVGAHGVRPNTDQAAPPFLVIPSGQHILPSGLETAIDADWREETAHE